MSVKKKRSLLTQYLFANLSLAAFSCAVVGLVLFSFATSQLNRVYEQEQLNRLALAVADLQRQEKILQDTALNIRTAEVYRLNYFQRDPTYELDLLHDLEKYQNRSQIVEQFFLLYRDNRAVYYPTNKSYYPLYMTAKLGVEDDLDALYQRFDGVTGSTLIKSGDGKSFLCYNLPLSRHTAPGDAVLAFYLEPSILLNRVETVMAQSLENLAVYYQGIRVSDTTGDVLPELFFDGAFYRNGRQIAARDETGEFVVTATLADNVSYAVLSGFRTACLIVFGIFVLIMTALSCWTAWRNYRPIWKLMRSYSAAPRTEKNELEQINRLIRSSMKSSEQAQAALLQKMEELEEQRVQVRRQLLLMLLSGNWEVPKQETQENGCLPLPLPYYGLLALRLSPSTEKDALCRMIEELSGEDMLFYASPLPETHCVVVLVNFGESTGLTQASDMIADLREECGFELLPGETCTQVSELSATLMKMFTQDPANEQATIVREGWEVTVNRIAEGFRQGQGEEAMEQLKGLLQALPGAYPSLMIRRYLYAGLMDMLQQTARQRGMHAEGGKPVASVLTISEEMLSRSVLQMGEKICAFESGRADEENGKDQTDQAVLGYIEQNALNWDLSLQDVAEKNRRFTQTNWKNPPPQQKYDL